MPEPLRDLKAINMQGPAKNQPRQKDFAVELAKSVFVQDPNKDKPESNIFKSNNSNLASSYEKFKKAETSHDEKKIKRAADIFAANFIMEDIKDGKLDLSPLENTNKFGSLSQLTKDISGNQLRNIIAEADLQDDGKVNGSVFSNKGLLQHLDTTDNGKADNSAQNFNSYIQEEGYNPTEAYGLMGSDDFSLDSLLSSDPFGLNEMRSMFNEIIYNPNEYADIRPGENYQYTVDPNSVVQDGVAGKALNIALGQVGNNNADGKYSQGRSEKWCADFATWALKKANGGISPLGKDISSVQEFVNAGKQKGLYRENSQESRNDLKPGDLMTFNTSRKKNGHIGIVSRVDRDKNGKVIAIHTVEGNSSNRVSERTYPVTNSHIAGYIKMS